MRRSDIEVTDPAEITEIMCRCDVLHIAVNTDTVPYILPVNFGMEPDGMTLYIHGAMSGTKYDLLARDPRVSFEMDCDHGLFLDPKSQNCSMNYESVIGWGIAEELTGEGEKCHALKRIMAQYREEDFPFCEAVISRTRIFAIRVRARTAKSRRKMRG